MPTVSIIMPAYNAANTITRSIECVLRQTFGDWELLIIDDGSTDDTRSVVERLLQERIKYFYQPNQGASVARNNGLHSSAGEYVVFLDSDDWWHPECLESLVSTLEAQPDQCAAAHCDWAYVDSADRVGLRQSSKFGRGPGLKTLILKNPFVIHAVLIRRSALLALGGFSPIAPVLEDWELWLRLASKGFDFVHVSRLLAYYHWTPGSKSKNLQLRRVERLATLDRFWAMNNLPGGLDLHKLKPASYATAHIDACVAHFGIGEDQDALHELDLAIRSDPQVSAHLDTYYRIIYAERIAHQTSDGFQESLNETSALHRLDITLSHLARIQEYKDVALSKSAAYHALGLAYYHERQSAKAQQFLSRAIRTPAPVHIKLPIVYALLRTFVPYSIIRSVKVVWGILTRRSAER